MSIETNKVRTFFGATGDLMVRASDYHALASERDQLRAELAKIRASELRWRQQLEQEWCELKAMKSAYATPQPQPDVAGLVKSLEWLLSCISETRGSNADAAVHAAEKALAAHRKD